MGFCDIEEGNVGLVVGVARGTQDADSPVICCLGSKDVVNPSGMEIV